MKIMITVNGNWNGDGFEDDKKDFYILIRNEIKRWYWKVKMKWKWWDNC